MIRTQIQLTAEQARRLKRLAANRNVSVAALIREAVDRLTADDDPDATWDRALQAVGRFHDAEAATDVAASHDRYLDDAYGR